MDWVYLENRLLLICIQIIPLVSRKIKKCYFYEKTPSQLLFLFMMFWGLHIIGYFILSISLQLFEKSEEIDCL